jgi:dipeptidyl-peptidase-3
MRRVYLIFLSLLIFSFISYAKDIEEKEYVDEVLKDLVAYRAYADGFEDLSNPEKLFAYYMTNAAIAGRDIFFKQMHINGITLRDNLDKILLHNQGIDRELFDNIKYYTYLFWNFGTNYDTNTDYSKIKPDFTPQELYLAAESANKNGANINIKELKSLEKTIFDMNFEPYLVKTGSIEDSSVNFYSNVSTDEVINFYKNYKGPVHYDENGNILGEIGLNTRVTKEFNIFGRGKKVVEQFPAEIYGDEINRIIYYLDKAIPFATNTQKKYINTLKEYLLQGDVYKWHLFNRDWLADNPNVDFVLGFVEVYHDPLNMKGSYESIVNYVNVEETKKQTAVAQNAQYYENNAPWDSKYKKNWTIIPVAKSVNILTEVGDAQTCCVTGINLPNEAYLRDNFGSKAVQLVNTLDARNIGYDKAFGVHTLEEFALPNEVEDALKYDDEAYKSLVYFHEITGHGGGKMASGKEGVNPSDAIGGYYNTLEEARADLTALWNMLDPKTAELGILSRRAAEAGYRDFVRGTLTMLRNFPNATKIVEAHRAAENMIVRYVMANTNAVEQKNINGKTYFVVNSVDGMREGVGKLLAEVQRIKSEADGAAAKELIETYGQYLDKSLRDEVIKRFNSLEEKYKLPRYNVMIHPKLILDDSNNVLVDNNESFMEQQLRYDKFNKSDLND